MVKIELYLNGAFITTAAPDYAALRAERNITADTLLINGHHRGWQTALADGDHALMFNAAQTPSPALWQAIYQARYGKEVMRRLQMGQVAICGLGGLGSLVAIELARLGVGRLLLIDGDTVDPTNLARQHYTISQIGQLKTQALATTLANFAPLTQVETATVWLNKDNIAPLLTDWPLICECLDHPENKALLTQTILTALPNATLVGSSGMAGYASGNAIISQQVLPHFYMVGDSESEGEDGIGLMAPRVGLCASAQATLIMRLLLGEITP
ncbi:MAG: sulfur carrier protein ThiS adenylyltransferase ThiF [Peptococcaceae bacterium]|nr:sulfur carrier protein ThiS adenylyltransferase ThiF [Peptococcaceae bacterium]